MKIKVLLLGVACIGASVTMSAQNLVVNGDFEDLTYVDKLDGNTYNIQTQIRVEPDGFLTNYIPGWDRRTNADGTLVPIILEENGAPFYELYNSGGANRWDVFWGIEEHSGIVMGDLDNYQGLDVRRYQDDGWGSHGRLTQTIKVEPSTLYHIKFIYAVPLMQEKKGSAPISRNISVYDETDLDNPLYEFKIDDATTQVEWTEVVGQFTTPASTSKIQLKVGLKGSWKDESGKNNVIALKADNFAIWKDGTAGVNNPLNENIKVNATTNALRIRGAAQGASVSVFNLSGQEIFQSVIGSNDFSAPVRLNKGVYVLKINNEATKVVVSK